MAEMAAIGCSDLVKTITVNVSIKGYNKFKVRLRIGSFLIRLGIRIIGMNAKIEIDE